MGKPAPGRRVRGDGGQMVVELVALIPVMLVVAAICANIIAYMGACAVFDRAAAEAVRVEGTSAGYGEYGAASRCAAIAALIGESFADADGVTVRVESAELGALTGATRGRGLLFSLLPSVRRYTCAMTYEPPFFARGAFGVGFPTLEHRDSYIVDPFDPRGWS